MKITKTSIKKTLKNKGWTVFHIYVGDKDPNCILCTAYDADGSVFEIFINSDREYATAQMLSSVMVHDSFCITDWFFEEEL